MNLDLDDILDGWDASRDEVAARLVTGDDGCEFVQLRVDLGLLQMTLDGRPDGSRPGESATVYERVRRKLARDEELREEDFDALHRELQQYNYRRLALSGLAERALREEDLTRGQGLLHRTFRDLQRCLDILAILRAHDPQWDEAQAVLVPTLTFNRVRLMTNLRVAQHRYEEAIEEAERGIYDLNQTLADAGYDEAQRQDNAAIAYLRQVAQRLREQYGITQTLRERLCSAIEREDFETAARLRDELRGRRLDDLQPRLPHAD